jgi:uncharacterized protein YprB with RNaseH-like and TPR domain
VQLARKLSRLTAPAPATAARHAEEHFPPPQGEPCLRTDTTTHGPLRVARRSFSTGHHHGHAPIAPAQSVDPHLVAALALDPRLSQTDFSRLLLIDTETTGLSGGTGTLPFLVGLGGFALDGSLELEQLLLRQPGAERPILARFAERMAAASCLVSYNGKAFDWPLLRSRFVMNRMTPPPPPPHLDLLHCARRVFRHRLEGARLVEIESAVLGHARHDDIPGALIPALYFDFLRGASERTLHPVLEHNASDLVLLVALLADLARRFSAPGLEDHAGDLLGCAEVAFRGGDEARALAFAEASAARAEHPRVHTLAWCVTARVRWRNADRPGAAAALQRALETADEHAAPALHLALAKLSEHAFKDLAAALDHAHLAAAAEPAALHARRLTRLHRKLTGRDRVAMRAPLGQN